MSKSKINVVLDLETLGIRENAAIIQIGMVVPEFDRIHLPDYIPYNFEATLDYNSARTLISMGFFSTDDETMTWWEAQDSDIRKQVFSGQESHEDAFERLKIWINSIRIPVAIWGNGADFDNRLLNYSLNALGFGRLWDFRNNRCLRTARALFELQTPLVQNPATKHTALGDATFEAQWLNTARNTFSTLTYML